MKNKKMVLWLALILMAIIPVYAQQYNPESDFKIDWDSRTDVKDGVVITGYIGTRREISIPPKIQNNPVTGIYIRDNENITKVIIPNGVETIRFNSCTSLTNITIPNGVKHIDFAYCSSLSNITIPNGVINFHFPGCTSLASINIPDSVTSILGGNFANCSSLTSITIPSSVKRIDENAFNGCTKLTSVTFQGSISDIHRRAFPGDLTDKYDAAKDGGPGTYTRFADGSVWRKTQSITVQPTQQPAAAVSAAAGTPGLAYTLNSDGKSYSVSNGTGTGRGTVRVIPATYNNLPVTIIAEEGFQFLRNITEVIIPNSIYFIGRGAFAQCKGLTNITIPDSVKYIDANAFRGCDNLTSVTFQGSITANNFSYSFNFPGDLRAKYLKEGSGTYTRPDVKSNKWTKQE